MVISVHRLMSVVLVALVKLKMIFCCSVSGTDSSHQTTLTCWFPLHSPFVHLFTVMWPKPRRPASARDRPHLQNRPCKVSPPTNISPATWPLPLIEGGADEGVCLRSCLFQPLYLVCFQFWIYISIKQFYLLDIVLYLTWCRTLHCEVSPHL